MFLYKLYTKLRDFRISLLRGRTLDYLEKNKVIKIIKILIKLISIIRIISILIKSIILKLNIILLYI